jgi:hypothetical protein
VAAYEGLTISYERGANGGSASKKA